MAYTTIQVSAETREKLAKLKTYERETYDELLNALLSLVPSGDDEGEYTDEFRIGLLRAKEDIRKNRVYSHEFVKKQLGL
ncbi:hypothetical protein H0N96_02015 [Candidatus Micrarchaeota archaeon]|jgi:recombinational DNA repair protein (RecF pathway)|nr:hypothetical protein [Candidatus Micrarchaeota archaeon]